jgi:flagellar biosynthesis protein FliR
MLNIEPILNHAEPFLMVLFRLSGLMIFAPVLSSSMIPLRIRAMFVFMLAMAMYPALPPGTLYIAQSGVPRLDVVSLAPAVFAETLIGAIIGLLASMPLYAAQMSGVIMGQQTGMTLGAVFNPALDTESDAVSQMLSSIALMGFLAMGGLESLWLALAHTFAHVPLGQSSITLAPVELLVGLAAAGFEVALRVAAPLMCILFVETLASAALMKTIPQLNIMSLGYGLKVMVGFLMLAAGIAVVGQTLVIDVENTLGQVVQWTRTLGMPVTPGESAESTEFLGSAAR